MTIITNMISNHNNEFELIYNEESKIYKVIVHRFNYDIIEVFNDYNKALNFLYGVLV